MKKAVFLAYLLGLSSTTSAYRICNGGTQITNTAETTFYLSNGKMNWW